MKLSDIKIGYSCNNNCMHCVIEEQKKWALENKGREYRTTEEYKKEILDSKKKGATHICVTGGEPTIRKDLFEILDFIKSLGLGIDMQTNGRMFFYNEFAKRFSAYDISFVIAVHGPNEEIHDSVTRSKNSFEQTTTGIKNLTKFNKRVYGKVVISKLNRDHLVDIVKLFQSLGVKGINLAFPHALGNARKYFNSVIPSYDSIKSEILNAIYYVEKFNKENQNNKLSVDFETIPFCIIGKNREKYSSDLAWMNKEVELKQMNCSCDWKIRRRRNKQKFESCKDCCYDDVCEGPWKEYAEHFGDREFVPVK